MTIMNQQTNIFWLVLAVVVVFIAQSYQQSSTDELQKSLASCQTEFKSFKDGVTYGK
ncbi:hypothetical protein H6G36_02270 [Anabaena minutissima FACHB-250]|nr:hypothetical protein [Anabaena minutissima FACHB-250]